MTPVRRVDSQGRVRVHRVQAELLQTWREHVPASNMCSASTIAAMLTASVPAGVATTRYGIVFDAGSSGSRIHGIRGARVVEGQE